MTNQEPVNIMGVVAFPNPDKEKQLIRFIDSGYNNLFFVPNGERIILTQFDGSKATLLCTYIDDYHAKIGSNTYHICEFAEIMERSGSIYAPEHPKQGDICDTYEIYQIKDIGSADYSFCSFNEAKNRIKSSDYKRVYAGVLSPEVTMEDLFIKHNRDDRPFGREMRSISVSDVLVVSRGGHKKAYYVDSIGFKEVKRFLSKTHTAPKKERGEAR